MDLSKGLAWVKGHPLVVAGVVGGGLLLILWLRSRSSSGTSPGLTANVTPPTSTDSGIGTSGTAVTGGGSGVSSTGQGSNGANVGPPPTTTTTQSATDQTQNQQQQPTLEPVLAPPPGQSGPLGYYPTAPGQPYALPVGSIGVTSGGTAVPASATQSSSGSYSFTAANAPGATPAPGAGPGGPVFVPGFGYLPAGAVIQTGQGAVTLAKGS